MPGKAIERPLIECRVAFATSIKRPRAELERQLRRWVYDAADSLECPLPPLSIVVEAVEPTKRERLSVPSTACAVAFKIIVVQLEAQTAGSDSQALLVAGGTALGTLAGMGLVYLLKAVFTGAFAGSDRAIKLRHVSIGTPKRRGAMTRTKRRSPKRGIVRRHERR